MVLRFGLLLALLIPALLCYSVILHDCVTMLAPLLGLQHQDGAAALLSSVAACALALASAYPMLTRFVPEAPVTFAFSTYLQLGLALTVPPAFLWILRLLPLDLTVALWAVLLPLAFTLGAQFLLAKPQRRTVRVQHGDPTR